MDAVNVSQAGSRESLLQIQDQSSRQRRKLAITISFIVLFSLIIGSIVSIFAVLKHNIEAQALSQNPASAIRSVCSVTPYPFSCFEAIWEFNTTKTFNPISPSEIFSLSLHAAFFELEDLISSTQMKISKTKNARTRSALRECEILFKHSMRLVNKTMEVVHHHRNDENLFKENKNIISVLGPWMTNATRNLDRCINGMEENGGLNNSGDLDEARMIEAKMDHMSKPYLENCLMMLVKMDDILDMFDPSLQSILANLLMSAPEYAFTVMVFCSQYLLIIVLLFLVLRLY